MKSRKITALAAMVVVVLLAACGIRSDQSVPSGEMAVPEVSSADLLVSSLQYLLLDSADENAQDQEQQDIQDKDVEESDSQSISEDSENVPDEQAPQDEGVVSEDDVQGEKAVIYYGNGGSSSLQQETTTVVAITPDELVNALARHNIVSLDTKVLSFEQKEQDNVLVLHLDMSKAVGVYMGTMSKEAECIIVAAITNTFLENFDADAICLTVEGEPLTTSNMEYIGPLEKCTPEELIEAFDSNGSNQDIEDNAGDREQSKLPQTVEKN